MFKKSLLIFLVFVISAGAGFAQKENISFGKQNKTANYMAFSAGMGANFCNNPSLKRFIEYEIPFYNNLSQNEKLAEFYSGFDFFGGAEFQLKKQFSVKAEYSYFTKSYNVSSQPNYDFTYSNHQPFITAYYVIPQEYSYIKIGAGAGPLFSTFTRKVYSAEESYTSTGVGLKLDLVVDFQFSKNVAGYIEGYVSKTFQGELKYDNGSLLLNKNNDTVDLNSLGMGIRLGIELFFFKL